MYAYTYTYIHIHTHIRTYTCMVVYVYMHASRTPVVDSGPHRLSGRFKAVATPNPPCVVFHNAQIA